MNSINTPKELLDDARQGEVLQMEATGTIPGNKKLFLESYGCQMNFSDSEVVAAILSESGYTTTRNIQEADLVLLNTCSIRENAETRVRNRLTEFKHKKAENPNL
ncbi:MAG: tRNA (N6-isopentenyl adenosine(37)-C2)-methylthiotransferase MiaB, partial [Flavobacteriia bacterium]|nr:tRNA (N6-isopentenyl adenosine(37)-C2)-methylthiotransferase MiaB [Flavobacteriia bacterium]